MRYKKDFQLYEKEEQIRGFRSIMEVIPKGKKGLSYETSDYRAWRR